MTDVTQNVEPAEPAHYRRGPSGANQWLICTLSPELQDPFEDVTTDQADEGTAAHWLLEQCLLAEQHAREYCDANNLQEVPAGEETGCIKPWPITGEMVEGVQLAIDTVEKDSKKKGTRLFVERRVRLDQHLGLPEPVGGTADIILYLPRSKTLKVLDFKYGRGKFVDVNANDGSKVYYQDSNGDWQQADPQEFHGVSYNPQIGIYALAAMLNLEELLGEAREVKWVELGIIQPRIEHKKGKVRTKKIAPLQFFALECALQQAFAVKRIVAGDHCHFCLKAPECETRAEAQAGISGFSAEVVEGKVETVPGEWVDAKGQTRAATEHHTVPGEGVIVDTAPAGAHAHNPPAPVPAPEGTTVLSDVFNDFWHRAPAGLKLEQLGAIWPHLKPLEKRIKELKEEVRKRWLHDLAVPGTMLAQGPGARYFGGDDLAKFDAAQTVLAESPHLKEDDIFKPRELRSPAQIEKAMGKKAYKASALGKLEVKEAGGPVLSDYDEGKTPYQKGTEFEAEAEPADVVTGDQDLPGSHLL